MDKEADSLSDTDSLYTAYLDPDTVVKTKILKTHRCTSGETLEKEIQSKERASRWSADFDCNGLPRRNRKNFGPAFKKLVESHGSKKYKSMIYKGTCEFVGGEYSLD